MIPPASLAVDSPADCAFAGWLAARGVAAEVTEAAGYRIYRPHTAVAVPG
ncbi:hypothetical protein [Phytohabitans rumicis]|nr:hypothetical protein [Phytohabitans rumicis]